MFVNTAGLGLDKLTARYKADQDDYSYIMAEALADRLAEAVAEKVHEDVRKKFWGYSPSEAFGNDDLLKVKYQVRVSPHFQFFLSFCLLLLLKSGSGCFSRAQAPACRCRASAPRRGTRRSRTTRRSSPCGTS